jgi:hypothetical protein
MNQQWKLTFKGGESYSAPTARALCIALNQASKFGKTSTLEHMIYLANLAEDYAGHTCHVNVSTYSDFLKGIHTSGFAVLSSPDTTPQTPPTPPQ